MLPSLLDVSVTYCWPDIFRRHACTDCAYIFPISAQPGVVFSSVSLHSLDLLSSLLCYYSAAEEVKTTHISQSELEGTYIWIYICRSSVNIATVFTGKVLIDRPNCSLVVRSIGHFNLQLSGRLTLCLINCARFFSSVLAWMYVLSPLFGALYCYGTTAETAGMGSGVHDGSYSLQSMACFRVAKFRRASARRDRARKVRTDCCRFEVFVGERTATYCAMFFTVGGALWV